MRLLRPLGPPLLFLLVCLWLTDPWIRNPATRMIGLADPVHGQPSVDVMLPLSFAGWLDFAPAKLHMWPLSRTEYLMFPRGAAHGDSFDGLLPALVTAALALALALPPAHSVAVALAFFMTGWVMWRLGRKRWSAAVALTVALAAMLCPYLMQRYLVHPNLLYIWTIPVAFMAFERWRERPDLRGTLGWALSFPLLALASWYILIGGAIFQFAATVALVAHALGRDPAVTRRHLATLPAAWLAGVALTALVAAPMLASLHQRRPVTEKEMEGFSAPLAQYLLPEPNSRAGRLAFVQEAQTALKTPWEARFSIPLVLTLLAVGWMLGRGGSVTKTALILTVVFGVLATLGPFLKVVDAGASRYDVPHLPLYYLYRAWHGAGVVRIPGRMIPVVFFAVAIGAGFALDRLGRALAARRARLAWPPILAGILAFCWWWSVPAGTPSLAAWPTVPEFYRQLAGRPDRAAVFDVPFSTYWFPHYDYYQLTHGKPEVSSVLYHDAVSKRTLDYVQKNPELAFFTDETGLIRPAVAERLADVAFLDWLAAANIGYVVVHPRFLEFLIQSQGLDPSLRDAYERIEAAWRPRLVYGDAQIRAYATAAPLREGSSDHPLTGVTRHD